MGKVIQFIPKQKPIGFTYKEPEPITHNDKLLLGMIVQHAIKLSESGAFEAMDMVHSIAEGGYPTGDEEADAAVVRKINQYLAENEGDTH